MLKFAKLHEMKKIISGKKILAHIDSMNAPRLGQVFLNAVINHSYECYNADYRSLDLAGDQDVGKLYILDAEKCAQKLMETQEKSLSQMTHLLFSDYFLPDGVENEKLAVLERIINAKSNVSAPTHSQPINPSNPENNSI